MTESGVVHELFFPIRSAIGTQKTRCLTYSLIYQFTNLPIYEFTNLPIRGLSNLLSEERKHIFLVCFHAGLVERIDAEHVSADGTGEFEEINKSSEIPSVQRGN